MAAACALAIAAVWDFGNDLAAAAPWRRRMGTLIQRRDISPLARAALLEDPLALTPDSTADAADADPGNGICDDGAGNCTLRAAIQEANGCIGADTIDLPAGTYLLTIADADEDAAATGDLDIGAFEAP